MNLSTGHGENIAPETENTLFTPRSQCSAGFARETRLGARAEARVISVKGNAAGQPRRQTVSIMLFAQADGAEKLRPPRRDGSLPAGFVGPVPTLRKFGDSAPEKYQLSLDPRAALA